MNRSNIKRLLLVLALVTLFRCAPETVNRELSEEEISTVTRLMDEAKISGLQLAYFSGNEITTFAGGSANLSEGSKVTESTIFRANDLGYSVLTAICFRLAEENRLDLNQSVTEDYQDPRLTAGTYNHLITYNHLLSHTGALPIWAEENESIDIMDVPGETWNYSHLGFEWITKALEAKMNTSIQELATEWVFKPLGITYSFFEKQSQGVFAEGHDLIGRTRAPGVANSTIFYTNASDYLKILEAFTDGFFKTESITALTQTMASISLWADETEASAVSWGPGLAIQSGSEGQALWQYSDEQTMNGFSIVYPQRNSGFVMLTNSANGFAIIKPLAKLFFSQNLPALEWLDYENYDSPEWQARRTLESAFAFEDSTQAVNTYLSMRTEQPDELNDALINNIIWSFFEQNELSAAERLARLHIAQFPDNANTYIRLGETLGFQSRYEVSWENYQKAMELEPESSRQIMPRFPWYMEATSAQQETQELPLEFFVGSFDQSNISIENNRLTYSDDTYQNVTLTRIGNTLFDLNGAVTFRLNFVLENGQVQKLEKSYLSGERTSETKNSI